MVIIDESKIPFKDIKITGIFLDNDGEYYMKIQQEKMCVIPREIIESDNTMKSIMYNAVCISDGDNAGFLRYFIDETKVYPVESKLIVCKPTVFIREHK